MEGDFSDPLKRAEHDCDLVSQIGSALWKVYRKLSGVSAKANGSAPVLHCRLCFVDCCYACWTALSFQVFGPTGRLKVQYSSNSIGSELLPLTTWPVLASTV